MLKPLIAGITALSLTFTTAAPVQANGLNGEDVGKLLIGVAAIAALSAAIENRREREKDRATPARDRTHRAPRVRGNDGWSNTNRNNNSWSDLNRNGTRRTLPHACIRSVETRFGNQRMFGRRCLERNYRHVDSLPGRCAVRVYSRNGPRRGFDPFCLREQGYRSDRRR